MAVAIVQTASPAGVAASSNVATYSSVSIGTASDDRIVVVLVATELASSTPSAVTIGGVSATAGTTGNFGAVYARAFYLAVPSGTTANIAVTYSATNPTAAQNKISVYAVTGAATSPTPGGDGSTDMDATDPLTTGSITIPSNGGFIAVAAGATDTVAKTWANATEDIDADVGNFRYTTATRTTSGTVTITCTGGTNGEDGGMSWLIFSPAPEFTQAAFRFYQDGAENTSTALQNQDTNHTADVSSGDVNLQLRVRLQETNGGAGAATDDYQLQYELNDSGTYVDVGSAATVASYYFDGSDAAASDPNSVFTNDSNAFDSDEATGATSFTQGSVSSNFLKAEGTNAPNGGGGITQVRVRLRANAFAQTGHAAIYTDSLGELLGTAVNTSFGAAWGSYTTLSTPSGGWTWAKVQALEVKCYAAATDGSTLTFYKVEIEVTSGSVLGFNSASLTDGNATTNRLGAGSGSFVAGEISEDGLVDDLAITASNYTELLYSLTVKKDAVSDADTLDFRVLRNGATTGLTYTVTPRITINKDPTFTQAEAAFYEDGTESGSTVIDSGADSITRDVSSGDSNLLLRMRLQETSGNVGAATDDYQLQYELNDGGTYTDVGVAPISYPIANRNTASNLSESTEVARGQSFTGDGSTLLTASFAIRKFGTPPGNMTVAIYAHAGTFGTSSVGTGAALATSDPIVASTVTTSFLDYSFTFSGANQIVLTNGTNYVVALEYVGPADFVNWIQVGRDDTSPSHPGNASVRDSGGTWAAVPASDLIFGINAPPVLNYNSASLTDGNATTNRLGSGSGSFLAGKISEDGLVDDWVNTANNFTEHLWALTIDSDAVADADTLDFRVLRNGATTGMTYTVTPRITIEKSAGDDHTLVTQDIALALTEDATTIAQNHVITAQDMAIATREDNTTITQNHVLTAQDMALALTEDNTTITQTHVLTAQDVALALSEDNTTITQTNFVLTVQDITLALTEDNTTITQNHIIVVQDMALGSSADGTTINQNHVLTAQDILLSTSTDNTTIEEEAELELVVQDIALALTIDNTSITQNHVLQPQDLALGSSTDNTTISQNHTIATQDILLSLTEDNTTITQNHILVTQDIALATTTDNTTLVENVTLAPADLLLSTTTDNTTLTQQHIVVTQDMLINTSLEATSLSIAGDLNSQDSTLALTIDATTITQNHIIVVQDIALALSTDNTTLSQNHVVATQDIQLATATDNTSVTQTNFALVTQDIALGLTEDNTTVAETNFVLMVQDIVLALSEDNTTIMQTNFALVAQDIALATRLDNASLQSLIEARPYYIDSDGNIYWVVNQTTGLVEKI